MSKENDSNEFNKPVFLYSSKDLKVYASVNEAAEAEAIYISNQKPVDRIKETVLLILRVFPLSEKKPNTDEIYFDKL